MTYEEKKKKAIAIAIAYYLDQEKAKASDDTKNGQPGNWQAAGRTIQMRNRQLVQKRGRVI